MIPPGAAYALPAADPPQPAPTVTQPWGADDHPDEWASGPCGHPTTVIDRSTAGLTYCVSCGECLGRPAAGHAALIRQVRDNGCGWEDGDQPAILPQPVTVTWNPWET